MSTPPTILDAAVAASQAIDATLGTHVGARQLHIRQLQRALVDAIAKYVGALAGDELDARRRRETLDEFDALARQVRQA